MIQGHKYQTNMAQYTIIELLKTIVNNMTDESQYNDFVMEIMAIDKFFQDDTEFGHEINNAWTVWQHNMYDSKGVMVDVRDDMIHFINVLTKST